MPRLLGPYQLVAVLGRGSFGTVYKARDAGLDRWVAIKVPRAGSFGSAEEEARFLREARSAAQLAHPLIVPVYATAHEDGVPYIVSEYVEGPTLADLLRDRRPGPREAAELTAQLAEALDYAHRQQVIHRDVKPQNVLVDAGGRPHITDFGLAHRDEESVVLTLEGQVLGTPAYMAPEVVAGHAARGDGRCDVYSLGVVLYELLTGERPFSGNVRMVLHQALHDEPRPPRRLNDAVPRDLETICLKAMAKGPAQRYPTAGDFQADLRRYLAGEPIRARPIGRLKRAVLWCRRNPVLAGLVGATSLSLLLGTGFGVYAIMEQRLRTSEARNALRTEALLALERGRALREQGEGGRGLLWLGRALEIAGEVRDPDLERVVRTNLAYAAGQTHALRMVFDLPGKTVQSALSPDGRTVYGCSGSGSVLVWDADTGERTRTLPAPGKSAQTVAVSPDGRYLLVGGEDRSDLWDMSGGGRGAVGFAPAGGGTRRVALEHPETVRRACFSPDGRTLLTGHTRGAVYLWDVSSGQRLLRLEGHQREVMGVAFSPDGKVLVTGSLDYVPPLEQARPGEKEARPGLYTWHVRFWDAVTGAPRGRPLECNGEVWSLAASLDGRSIAAGLADATAVLWEARTRQPRGRPLPHQGHVHALAFSPDSRALATGSQDSVHLWAMDNGQPFGNVLAHQGSVWSVSFTRDGQRLLTGSADGQARLWEVAGLPWKAVFPHRNYWVGAAAFSPDGKTVLTGSWDKTALAWDAATGKTKMGLKHAAEVSAVAFSPDGQTILTAGWDGHVRFVDAKRAKEERRFRAHDQRILAAALSADGRTIVTGSEDRTARVWGWDGRPRAGPLTHTDQVLAVAISPDSSTVLTGGKDRTARLWDAATGAARGEPLEHQGEVLAVAFAPDGNTFATGSKDTTVRFWSTATGRPHGKLLSARTAVGSIAFAPDGRALLTGTDDGKVQLWDLATGLSLGTPFAHLRKVRAVAFSPDGKHVLSAGDDNRARTWEVLPPIEGDTEHVLLWARTITGLELDREGASSLLDAGAWRERYARLRQRGGKPR